MLSRRELSRKCIHVAVGVTASALFYFDVLSPLGVFFLIIAGVLLSFIVKRIRIPLISTFLDLFERDDLRKTFPGKGTIFFFIGMLLVIKLFPKDIALASLMILTFGDSVSHIIGAEFGSIKNIFNGKSKKLLEGTLAGTLAGCAAAVLFVPFPEAFLGSLGAMIAEVVQIDFNERTLDDNVVVPLVAGAVMVLLGKVMGG